MASSTALVALFLESVLAAAASSLSLLDCLTSSPSLLDALIVQGLGVDCSGLPLLTDWPGKIFLLVPTYSGLLSIGADRPALLTPGDPGLGTLGMSLLTAPE